MGFNREVIRRRRDELDAMGVRVRWAGRRRRLWRSVIDELEEAERRTAGNSTLTLQFCVNYGGRAEIADAAAGIARDVAAGRLDPAKVDERTVARYLDEPGLPDVDLFLRSSGEQRTSNFLIWQSAYAEMVFLDVLWPDFDRRDLWQAIEIYARRDRRYGGALRQPGPRPPVRAVQAGSPCRRGGRRRGARSVSRPRMPLSATLMFRVRAAGRDVHRAGGAHPRSSNMAGSMRASGRTPTCECYASRVGEPPWSRPTGRCPPSAYDVNGSAYRAGECATADLESTPV